jgi:hypothetical protein
MSLVCVCVFGGVGFFWKEEGGRMDGWNGMEEKEEKEEKVNRNEK